MEWLILSQALPVSTLVFVLAFIAFAGVSSWGLYRPLLTSRVEYGEAHPANVRRFLWWLFVTLSALGIAFLLRDHLRPAAYWLLGVSVVVVGLVALLTRKKV